MKMKILIFTLLTVLSLGFVTLYSPASDTDNNMSEITEIGSTPAPMYILRNTNGIIGVYEGNSDTPKRIIDVNVKTLPQKDRDSLNKGINIFSNSELQTIIEDLTS